MNLKTITKLTAMMVVIGLTAATQATTITLQVGTGATSGSGAIKNSTSPYVLGEFVPGVVGANGQAARDADMVNALLTLSPGGTGSFNLGSNPPESAQRSLNVFIPAPPAATDVGAVLVGQASGSGNFTAAVPAGGYTYYVVQWDGPNGGAMAYDIAGIAAGTLLELPINAYGHGQTGGSFLKSTGTNVPDGGATVALLGVGLLGLGAMRRKLS